jgi:hypothetical protein
MSFKKVFLCSKAKLQEKREKYIFDQDVIIRKEILS